ncbi:imitation switch two complex protein 1 [Rhypophila decipiens]
MVLYKRKPVQLVPVPDDIGPDDEVWTIKETGEVFKTYEEYLVRQEFYKQKKFICVITGHSALNFFDALRSEQANAEEIEQAFPEALKGPVLRKVQFKTTSRIDTLVDQVYDDFKTDYYPHEAVIVNMMTGDRLHGVIRDKAIFSGKTLPDGTAAPPRARYFVSLDERPGEEAVCDETQISRDRKVFTKSVIRSFLKGTTSREAWTGAPWIVKPDVARRYNISTTVPEALRHETKLAERKKLALQKRQSMGEQVSPHPTPDSMSPTGPVRLPDLKPAPKSHKSKAQQAQQAHNQANGTKHKSPNGFPGIEPGGFVHMPLPGSQMHMALSLRTNQEMHHIYTQQPQIQPPPPPPPPPKGPIDDLQLQPQGRVRPKLKYFCNDPPVDVEPDLKHPFDAKILMKSVGPLLETWDTLNVYVEVLQLDSFTFDDFVEALHIATEELPVELFTEVHCAVLKLLVSAEDQGGKPQIELPELEVEDDEDEEEEQSAEPTPEPEPKPAGRATRRSLAKAEAEKLAAAQAEAERKALEAENAPKHRAEELLSDYNWIEQLAKRQLQDGGWQMIMVGLLHQLSKKERRREKCEELLQQLVPTEIEQPSQETVRERYSSLDVNYRIQALQIICQLCSETKAFREYMETCSTAMTDYRKQKIELQRNRKQAIEELKALNEERKILLPDNLPPSPPLEPAKTNGDVSMTDLEDVTPMPEEVPDSGDESVIGGRALRKGKLRAAERKRKAELEQERKEKAEAAAKVPKQSKQFLKLLKDIEAKEKVISDYEKQIGVIDDDLRENDCNRTRVLGKDRFFNRYYWFERNGMPFAGLPESSTAHAKYANGCIWVQGPDELEREGYIDMPSEWQDEYKAKFDMTVPERKKLEEGPTSVFNAYQWGFYSEPEEIDALLGWLNDKGLKEGKLRKELIANRENIAKHMEARKAYIGPVGGSNANGVSKEDDDKIQKEGTPAPAPVEKPNKRMSTRGRTTAAPTPEVSAPKYRCLSWHNTDAIEQLGHLHSEQPAPVRARKPTKRKSESAAIVAEAAESTGSRKKKARHSRG